MTWLHDLIGAQPAHHVALVDHDGTRFDYGTFRDMVETLTERLVDAGLRPGDRLMLVSENCATYAVAIMAASRVGAWIMPVNARQTAEELAALRAHAGPRLILFTPEASTASQDHAARFGASHAGALSCGEILLAGPFETPETAPQPTGETPETRVAALMYTTGTTSAPKGVMLTHRNLTWNAMSSARLREIVPDDEVIGVLPGTHIFGFSSAFLAAMHAGGSIRFMTRFDAGAVLDAIAEGGAVLPAVPQMYQAMLTEIQRRGGPVVAPKLHYISSGGAPLDPAWKERVEAAFGLPLHNGYGLTETSPGVCGGSNARPRKDLALGEILPDVECIVDEPDAEGVGELLIRGPNIMLGYFRNPDATRAAIRDDGFFRSGDFARIDPDGAVWLMGRKKELIIRSGFNVYPPEVEAMLTRHPGVHQTAVVGRNVPGNEEIIAFVTATPGIGEEELKGFLHENLVAYKVPQHIVLIDDFPRAATGKILKHKLVDLYSDELARRDAVAI
ncbi:class I adenylate-forming enzyme family protein [Maritimibacter dapengensis]|uniref:AMP-binding protein n=1 Tax=Maritimibacter dapengensis TaxID=2836868 RepID=A0ABS6SY02_9RHOB|nr:AMP-binding protein [Maritimibacter dapengensis]MBV7377845.1 AMP-binding protein [Maritimibacter dapengensis]